MRIFIYVTYRTGNLYEPMDVFTDILYMPYGSTTSEILEEIKSIIDGYEGVIGYTWEVDEEYEES